MGKKTRRVFDKEFKTKAVRLVSKVERTISEVANSPDIDASLLSKWIRTVRRTPLARGTSHTK